MQGYSIALPKPPRKPISSFKYSIFKHHGSTLLEGYYSCSKLHNTLAISHKYNGLHNISFQTWKGFAIPKPKRKVILASYCNNILNHETKGFFLIIYSMFNITCLTY
jgi:hypothetical protein